VAQALQKEPRMVDPIFQSTNYQLARTLLDASVMRHTALAANIANADTPGYRRLDLAPDFSTELRARMAGAGRGDGPLGIRPRLAEDLHSRSIRPDGNSVEIERELLEMNRNGVNYEFLTDLVSRNIKQLRLAITGRPV
jgi:flagellar basal-body rod protein FlgB